MKHDDDRIIDLQKIKSSRLKKKRLFRMLIFAAALVVLMVVGLMVAAQILEVIGPGDFWSNFAV